MSFVLRQFPKKATLFDSISTNSLAEAKKEAELLKAKRSGISPTDKLLLDLLETEIKDRDTLETVLVHGVEKKVYLVFKIILTIVLRYLLQGSCMRFPVIFSTEPMLTLHS